MLSGKDPTWRGNPNELEHFCYDPASVGINIKKKREKKLGFEGPLTTVKFLRVAFGSGWTIMTEQLKCY